MDDSTAVTYSYTCARDNWLAQATNSFCSLHQSICLSWHSQCRDHRLPCTCTRLARSLLPGPGHRIPRRLGRSPHTGIGITGEGPLTSWSSRASTTTPVSSDPPSITMAGSTSRTGMASVASTRRPTGSAWRRLVSDTFRRPRSW